jgi:FlgD Ig-like domain
MTKRLAFIRPLLLTLCIAAVPAAAVAQTPGPPPICDISGATTVTEGTAFHLCGPIGVGYFYSWHDAALNLLSTDRCIDIGPLPVGEYDYEFTISQTFPSAFIKCPVHLIVTAPGVELVCPQVPSVCNDTPFQICGQEGDGLTYTWSGDGITGEVHTRCIDISGLSAGPHTIHYVVSHGDAFRKCDLNFVVNACNVNCPHTIGYWKQQCAQKGNGSTKLTVAQVTSIAGCIDDQSAAFSWANDFDGFCATMNPAKVDQRTQAKRQFAGVLANFCSGDLDIVNSIGQHVALDLDTPFSCGSLNVNTIGQFIHRADSILVALEGQNLDNVKTQYSQIIDCATSINEGIGIGRVCGLDKESLSGSAVEESGIGSAKGVIMARPNPFVADTRLSYTLDTDAQVEINVFDLAGRKVANLASGLQSAGQHQTSWNGRNTDGARVKAGVYFVRGTIGSKSIASRLLMLQ